VLWCLRKPSVGCVDGQSIKTAPQVLDVGFDENKKIKGRKRHVLIDTLGLIVAAVVTAANKHNRQGLAEILKRYFLSGVQRLRTLWVDGVSQALWLLRTQPQTDAQD
jgi:putative transposase